ncbi:hypothetical protein X743_33130 [Mesorhizobium sp. LNHC252B00]|nr:hypothetical protein X743_33130 [Mesorhizobium sp. LNHC252B00]
MVWVVDEFSQLGQTMDAGQDGDTLAVQHASGRDFIRGDYSPCKVRRDKIRVDELLVQRTYA